MNRTVLVTGGAGYVGSHACKALARAGWLPVTYDNLSTGNLWAIRWGPFEPGDIRDRPRLEDVIQRHRIAAVLHFAAVALVGESVREPELYYDVNVAGTLAVLQACRARGVPHLVLSSSCATYGIPASLPITEGSEQRPINPYGMSKLMAERILADFARSYGISYATLRYFNAAGADPDAEIGEHRRHETHLIPLILDAVRGLRPPVQLMGEDHPTPDGTAIRDYVHVSDLADAHVAALDWLAAGGNALVLNLGTGRGHSVREVIAAAEAVTGRAVPLVSARKRPGDPPELVADATTARWLLRQEFRHSQSLEQIIGDAWRWHEGWTAAHAA